MNAHPDNKSSDKPSVRATSHEQADLEGTSLERMRSEKASSSETIDRARKRASDRMAIAFAIAALAVIILVFVGLMLLPSSADSHEPASFIVISSSGEAYDLGEPLAEKESEATSSSSSSESKANAIPESTIRRTPLPPAYAKGGRFYTDEDNTHIAEPMNLEQGCISFYDKTGIKPYIYILSEDSPLTSSVEDFTKKGIELYDELFDDEAHFLILYYTKGAGWDYGLFVGSKARAVMDEEAQDIFKAYLLENHGSGVLPIESVFAISLNQTAEHIMKDPHGALTGTAEFAVFVISIGVFLVLLSLICIAVIRYSAKCEARYREIERMETVLTLPLDQLDDIVFDER